MNITFNIRNYRRISDASLTVERITFVGGPNGKGKTSLSHGMASLLTGERLPASLDLSLSEANALVRSGAMESRLKLTGPSGEASLSYPKADYRILAGTPPQASKYAAGLVSVLDLPKKEAGIVLSDYLKSAPDMADLITAITESGIVSKEDQGKPVTVATPDERQAMPPLRLDPDATYDLRLYRYAASLWSKITAKGWDGTLKDARTYGAEQKGAWQHITGEKAYQPAGADNWCPPGWRDELAVVGSDALQTEIDMASKELESAIAKGAVDQGEIKRLEELGNSLGDDINTPYAERQKHQARINLDEAMGRLAKLPQPGESLPSVTCPHCGSESVLVSEGNSGFRLEGPDPENGAGNKDERQKRIAAIAKVKAEVEKLQAEHDRASSTLERAKLADAERAKARDRLKELKSAPDNSAAISQARLSLDEAKARQHAKTLKESADKAHRNVKNNQKLVDILAPDGLRRTKLQSILESFNTGILVPLCKQAGFDDVTIDEDMVCRYGGFPYPLLAESHKFRARVILQCAMARLDGSSMMIIDGADILDRPARIGLLNMLMQQECRSVVLATYDKPDKLPQLYKTAGGATYWIEDGVLVSVGETDNSQSVQAAQ